VPELARETTSSFGTSISSVALPLVALSVPHASVFAVTMLTAAAWLPWLLVGLPAGAWLDRLPRRRIMMVADLVSLFGSVPVAAALGWLTIAQLVVVALIAGTASVFFLTAYRAFLPALLDAGDLLEGNAKLQGSEQVTYIAGPAAAGLIAQATSAVGGVLADAMSFAVSAVGLVRVHATESGPADSPWTESRRTDSGHAGADRPGRDHRRRGSATARRIGSARAILLSKVGFMPFGLLIPLADRGPGLGLFLLGSLVIISGIVAGNIIWRAWRPATSESGRRCGSCWPGWYSARVCCCSGRYGSFAICYRRPDKPPLPEATGAEATGPDLPRAELTGAAPARCTANRT
jgi:MFS family permease